MVLSGFMVKINIRKKCVSKKENGKEEESKKLVGKDEFCKIKTKKILKLAER